MGSMTQQFTEADLGGTPTAPPETQKPAESSAPAKTAAEQPATPAHYTANREGALK